MEVQDYMVNKISHASRYGCSIMFVIYSFLILVGLSGCETKVVEKHYTSQDYTTAASAFIIHEGIVNPSKGGGGEVSTKYKRSECPECKGSGVLVSGDGLHRQTCPYCEVDKGDVGQIIDEVIKPKAFAQCCPHCICGEDCQCVYLGQCLIKKNNGWPVKICNGAQCAVYYPQDTVGTSYDPFQLLSPQDQIRYNKYKTPVPIDSKGNPISEQVFSQGCAACAIPTRRGR